jgi:N-acetylglucosaminyldiphosphoundecaprenol N-acetyl-beta-D-mannosaminyltransferase
VTALGLPTVRIAGIDVVDAPMRTLLEVLPAAPERPVLAFALHIGGLTAATDPTVSNAYACADLTYADGISAVLLARLAGAEAVDRSATTDLAPLLFDAFAAAGAERVFLIGGPSGLAEAAGLRLARDHGVKVVGCMPGYDVDRAAFLTALEATRPDIVLVGLGSPREMFFLSELRTYLPPGLYLTCGGWFGFLAGEEIRAPALLRSLGLEWLWRLLQDPTRLAGRYARGVWTMVRLAGRLLGSRSGREADPSTGKPPHSAAT